jgi:hypothetical protein
MNLMEICCEDGRRIELDHDLAQLQDLELADWNLQVILPPMRAAFPDHRTQQP